MGPLTKEIMLSALVALNERLAQQRPDENVSLIMGGGGAMILAHGFPKGTTDIDAVPRGMAPDFLRPFVHEIATSLSLPMDWLNPYFSTFVHVLPADYGDRLIRVYQGSHLEVEALGKEEMLLMKCFAGRAKDIPHARALLKGGAEVDLVESRLDELSKRKIPGTEKAIHFLQELLDE
ncbi:MAG: hypothetical protein KGP28_11215 [Bdellovibrionales bacterium]|nr:hypothetical protein [Bdellovibrionales bacterium]